MLEDIVEADERTHVHAVDPDAVPRQLVSPTTGHIA
jgi:hypothetical protein